MNASTSLVLQQARQMFFVEGSDPGPDVAPHIVRSWRRCGGRLPVPEVAEPVLRGELSQRREAAAWLRQCAQPELDGLAEHALGCGCVVILSDAGGLILDEVGSPEFLPKAQRVALTPGVDWSEAQRGTNAIGTALLEREALMVLGGEHFLAQNGALGCAAAPIFNAQGELAGVLDISGETVHVDFHALGLVRLAAAQVEHRMMSARGQRPPGAQLLRSGETQLLRFHRRPGLLGTPREGLLSMRDGIIVGANRTALALLGMDWSDALGAPVDCIFGARWQRLQQAPGLVASADGQQWAATLDPMAEPPAGRAASPPAAAKAPPIDALEALLARAGRVAAEGLPILVTGETGSGKEVFVRRLHRLSRRAAGPLVAVNCAALPDTLIEAELFGYEEGAFTGARRRGLPGRLREAQGGILFLDEIGDMPIGLQSRLLRVLEDRLVRPLGSSQDFAVDFDLVCATHMDLPALVREGRFREDLLYRLQGFVVVIPPLRQRADRSALIQRLFKEAGAGKGLRLTSAALSALEQRPWPGNVRELQSTLRSLAALADAGATLDAGDLCPKAEAPTTPAPAVGRLHHPIDTAPELEGSLAALTEDAIQHALLAKQGNVAEAARSLGVHRSTLYRQLARKRRST